MKNPRKSQSKKNFTEPQPETSGICKPASVVVGKTEDSTDDDSEVCCECNLFIPRELRFFVTWVQCTRCGHWIYLIFRTSVRVVRRGDVSLYKHCTPEE